jgi:hypothetical protein
MALVMPTTVTGSRLFVVVEGPHVGGGNPCVNREAGEVVPIALVDPHVATRIGRASHTENPATSGLGRLERGGGAIL